KIRRLLDVPGPRAIRIANQSLAYVISDHSTVMALDLKTGTTKPVITGLANAVSLALDADGKIYVGVRDPDQQVKIFTPDGKPAGEIGRPGGRPVVGVWQTNAMLNVGGIVVDARKRLWATEMNFNPKRISVWNLSDGKFVTEYYGPTRYGASGAAIDPLDPNIMVSEGAEWKLDPATGQARCTGSFSPVPDDYAVFCTPAGGKTYVATVRRIDTTTTHGRYARLYAMEVFERVAEGDWKLRASVIPDRDGDSVHFWSDGNGDGKVDDNETVTVPRRLLLTGSNGWSLSMNPKDFTIYAADATKQEVVQILPAG